MIFIISLSLIGILNLLVFYFEEIISIVPMLLYMLKDGENILFFLQHRLTIISHFFSIEEKMSISELYKLIMLLNFEILFHRIQIDWFKCKHGLVNIKKNTTSLLACYYYIVWENLQYCIYENSKFEHIVLILHTQWFLHILLNV